MYNNTILDFAGPDMLSSSKIPLLIERPGHHDNGAHVLFMDGHVEFIDYPGKFPMTEEFISELEKISAMKGTE